MPRKLQQHEGHPLPAVPVSIEHRIIEIRGHRVMFDGDLAELYGVETRALNQGVKRNRERFPADFMFQLTMAEWRRVRLLRSQIVILERGKYAKFAPYVFTEQGVAMLSTVLRSQWAIDVNIAIMRAFVHLRELLTTRKDLARRIDELERKYDGKFAAVFDAIRRLMSSTSPEEPPRPRIGFTVDR